MSLPRCQDVTCHLQEMFYLYYFAPFKLSDFLGKWQVSRKLSAFQKIPFFTSYEAVLGWSVRERCARMARLELPWTDIVPIVTTCDSRDYGSAISLPASSASPRRQWGSWRNADLSQKWGKRSLNISWRHARWWNLPCPLLCQNRFNNQKNAPQITATPTWNRPLHSIHTYILQLFLFW